MESNLRYYARRAAQEHVAARNAITAEARQRRLALAASFEAKLAQLSSLIAEQNGAPLEACAA